MENALLYQHPDCHESPSFCSEPELQRRSGQSIQVIRNATEADRCDIEEVGPMYLVSFPDGYTEVVFDDEISTGGA